MPSYSLLSQSDKSVVSEILAVGYDELIERHPRLTIAGESVETNPNTICLASLCREASDSMTRAALSIGILASREAHEGHALTSFAPLDQMPAEDDLILCTTWGQFNRLGYMTCSQTEFFGPRKDIKSLVDRPVRQYYYDGNYSSPSVVYRQTAFASSKISSTGYAWLSTTPEQIMSGNFPVGEISLENYPENLWHHPAK